MEQPRLGVRRDGPGFAPAPRSRAAPARHAGAPIVDPGANAARVDWFLMAMLLTVLGVGLWIASQFYPETWRLMP